MSRFISGMDSFRAISTMALALRWIKRALDDLLFHGEILVQLRTDAYQAIRGLLRMNQAQSPNGRGAHFGILFRAQDFEHAAGIGMQKHAVENDVLGDAGLIQLGQLVALAKNRQVVNRIVAHVRILFVARNVEQLIGGLGHH